MSAAQPSSLVLNRTIVLTGMMGAGKSSVGRRLAAQLALPFFDVDDEIVKAAGMPVVQIFADYGEPEFRRLEQRIIARLLDGPAHVLSTGGGAFMNEDTRALVRAKGISVWLKADPALLLERIMRRDDRPMLHGGDPRATMDRLLAERIPIYAEADVTVECDNRPVDETVDRVTEAIPAAAAQP
jgi:shikimate kinase